MQGALGRCMTCSPIHQLYRGRAFSQSVDVQQFSDYTRYFFVTLSHMQRSQLIVSPPYLNNANILAVLWINRDTSCSRRRKWTVTSWPPRSGNGFCLSAFGVKIYISWRMLNAAKRRWIFQTVRVNPANASCIMHGWSTHLQTSQSVLLTPWVAQSQKETLACRKIKFDNASRHEMDGMIIAVLAFNR